MERGYGIRYSVSGTRPKVYSMGWPHKKPQPPPANRASGEYVPGWADGVSEWLDELEKDGSGARVAGQRLLRHGYGPGRGPLHAIGTTVWRRTYGLRSQAYLFGGITISGRHVIRNVGKCTAASAPGVIKEMHGKWGRFGSALDRASRHAACIAAECLADHAGGIRTWWLPAAWS